MRNSSDQRCRLRNVLLGIGLLVIICATGCQVDVGGQTMPSAYYMGDDVQYHPPGPEFKLAREAAAMSEYAQEEALRR